MGMTDFLNLPKSKPGSSGELGASLLAGKIRRSEKQAESKDSFGKWMTGAKALAKGTKWWLNEDVDNFHRGNSTLYANLDGLILSNQQVLADQQAITASKLSAKDFYAQKYYDKWVSDAVALGKRPQYSLLKEAADRIAKESADRQATLYEAAKKMPTTIKEYKDAAVDYYDKPENVFEKGLEKGRKLFGKMNPEVMKLREGKLTMQKLADFEDDGMFDAAMAFKVALATKTPDYLSAVADILDKLPAELDKFSVDTEVSTDNRKEIPDPNDKSGKTMMPNPNFNKKSVTKIVTLIDKDGKDRSGPVEIIPLNEFNIMELVSDTFQNMVTENVNASGQKFINIELMKLDPAYNAATKTGGTIAGALDYLTEIQDKSSYYAIIDKALAIKEYRIIDKESTTVEDMLLKSALTEFNAYQRGVGWNFSDAADRIEAAGKFKEVISGVKLLGRAFTKTTGDTTITEKEVQQRINDLDEELIIGYIKALDLFGTTSTLALSDPFTP